MLCEWKDNEASVLRDAVSVTLTKYSKTNQQKATVNTAEKYKSKIKTQ